MTLYCLPEDGDVSLKHVGEFMHMDDLRFNINYVHLLVYTDKSQCTEIKI